MNKYASDPHIEVIERLMNKRDNLQATVDRQRKLLEKCADFMSHGPEFPYHLSADAEDLQSELAKELADD